MRVLAVICAMGLLSCSMVVGGSSESQLVDAGIMAPEGATLRFTNTSPDAAATVDASPDALTADAAPDATPPPDAPPPPDASPPICDVYTDDGCTNQQCKYPDDPMCVDSTGEGVYMNSCADDSDCATGFGCSGVCKEYCDVTGDCEFLFRCTSGLCEPDL